MRDYVWNLIDELRVTFNDSPMGLNNALHFRRNAANIITRAGVEDTWFEAKAKDTKKSEAKAKDSPSEDRHSRGQGRECSRPRTKDTNASVLKKRSPNKLLDDLKKKVFKIFFQAISKKKTVQKKVFQPIYKILTIQKIVLSLSRGQGKFRGIEASMPDQGLDLRG